MAVMLLRVQRRRLLFGSHRALQNGRAARTIGSSSKHPTSTFGRLLQEVMSIHFKLSVRTLDLEVCFPCNFAITHFNV